jgi:hypothetical protein
MTNTVLGLGFAPIHIYIYKGRFFRITFFFSSSLFSLFNMLEAIYNSYAYVKAAFIREKARMNQYDPYQVDQLQTHFRFNPYHKEKDAVTITEETYDEFFDIDPQLEAEFDDDECDESMVMVDKANQVDDEDQERPFKRMRTMARSATDNALHTFLSGAVIAYDFIWTEKKKPLPPPVEPVKKMRGFGVDFSPLVDRSASLQFHIERVEKQAPQPIQKTYGGLPIKRTFDDHNWGLIEKDCTVRYKVISSLIDA